MLIGNKWRVRSWIFLRSWKLSLCQSLMIDGIPSELDCYFYWILFTKKEIFPKRRFPLMSALSLVVLAMNLGKKPRLSSEKIVVHLVLAERLPKSRCKASHPSPVDNVEVRSLSARRVIGWALKAKQWKTMMASPSNRVLHYVEDRNGDRHTTDPMRFQHATHRGF